ncbi:MAG TPA: GNAT family N-acetyltransferase [Patescibacteria group bacterium]|jgi:tagatose 1,6-diphosphate aldolase|nr:GNAT family N-acetyltransferase [Patescibacteria group bacterium]
MNANVCLLPPPNLAYGRVKLKFDRLMPAEPSRGFVPYYHLRILTCDGQDVGHINFRVGDSEHIRVTAGHIGYHIMEHFRGHGYALQACRAIAPYVRHFYSVVTITCDPDNHASRRTIEKLGARFVDEIEVPANDPHYEKGARKKRRYLWTP